jgi:hypothetical protein
MGLLENKEIQDKLEKIKINSGSLGAFVRDVDPLLIEYLHMARDLAVDKKKQMDFRIQLEVDYKLDRVVVNTSNNVTFHFKSPKEFGITYRLSPEPKMLGYGPL